MTDTLSFLGSTVIECVKIIFVMCGILNYRLRKTVVPLIILLLSLTLFFVFHNTLSKAVILCSSFIAILLNCFSIEGKNKILVTVLSFLSICCLDEINTMLLIVVMPMSYDEIIDHSFYNMLANSISIVILSLFSCLSKSVSISEKYKKNMKLTDRFYLYMFVIGQVGVLLYISTFNIYNKDYNDNKTNIIIMFVACAAIVLLLIIEFMLIYNINSKKYYREMSAVNQKLLNDKENYYKMLLNRENETKKFRHDFSNHILCLDVLLKEEKYDEAKEYLSSMKLSTAALKNKYDTGNILINAIVNDIISRYEGINLEWNGGVPDNLLISDVDICTIFSNILDNAFKAASDTDSKNVDVTIKAIANNMMIVVGNDKSNKVNMVNGRFITGKDDKDNHGIGTQNVRDSVNSYEGSIEFSFDDKRFSVEILLPNVLSVVA